MIRRSARLPIALAIAAVVAILLAALEWPLSDRGPQDEPPRKAVDVEPLDASPELVGTAPHEVPSTASLKETSSIETRELRVTALDASTGAALLGARVRLEGTEHVAITDEDGSAILSPTRDSAGLVLALSADGVLGKCEFAQDDRSVSVRVDRSVSVTGRILDAVGDGVALTLTFEGQGTDSPWRTVDNLPLKWSSRCVLREVTSASNGQFQIHGLPAGKYTVRCATPGWELASQTSFFHVTSPAEDIELLARRGRLITLAFVDDKTGEPLPPYASIGLLDVGGYSASELGMLPDQLWTRLRFLWPSENGIYPDAEVDLDVPGYGSQRIKVRLEEGRLRRAPNPVLGRDDELLSVPVASISGMEFGSIEISTPWPQLSNSRPWVLALRPEGHSGQSHPAWRRLAVAKGRSLLLSGVQPGSYDIAFKGHTIAQSVIVSAGGKALVTGDFTPFTLLSIEALLDGRRLAGVFVLHTWGKATGQEATRVSVGSDGLIHVGPVRKSEFNLRLYRSGEGTNKAKTVDASQAGSEHRIQVHLVNRVE